MEINPLLTAKWSNLLTLTYTVDANLLLPHLPRGLELDDREGRFFVSFTALEFKNLHVGNFQIPFYNQFPAVHLRFYVRFRQPESADYQRGVVFINQLLPRKNMASFARRVFRVPCVAMGRMASQTTISETHRSIAYEWATAEGANKLRFQMIDTPHFPAAGSSSAFFNGYDWLFSTNSRQQLLRSRIEHPAWRVYPIHERFFKSVRFRVLFGEEWSVLDGQIPYNILAIEGSPVKIYRPQLVR